MREVWEVWGVWGGGAGDGEMGRFLLRVIIRTSYQKVKDDGFNKSRYPLKPGQYMSFW
ncbi:MAG: hypothetical protein F6J98_16070 [Moorea sp. SIO4G2]|uniref:hypothetical protein n=1 Tax=unclassified Moorena TaxID=2683338 RepID=UPI0013B8C4A8|nr:MULTISPECIES: hypothetical protein [unclassified Moorena]NEO61862.1 hypothetical protein [Moorena sp. SIO4G2]NEQ84562.1 hypothetical protein [Moorena sp. SIO2I5]